MVVREGYKLTEVGVLPEDWDMDEFGDVIRFTYWDDIRSRTT